MFGFFSRTVQVVESQSTHRLHIYPGFIDHRSAHVNGDFHVDYFSDSELGFWGGFFLCERGSLSSDELSMIISSLRPPLASLNGSRD